MSKKIFNFFGIAIIIFIWFFLAYFIKNELVVPKISSVLKGMFEISFNSKLYITILISIFKIFFIMSISLIISTFLAIYSYKSTKFEHILEPIMALIKTMPLITIIILIFMLLNMKYTSIVATLLVSIPIMYEGILNAFKTIDSDMLDDLKTLTDYKSLGSIMHIQIPITMSYIKTTFVQTLGLGFKVMLMTEYISPSNYTLGASIRMYYSNNEMNKVYCIVIISIIIVAVVNKIVQILSKVDEKKGGHY